MIKVELTYLWDGEALQSREAENENGIREAVKDMVSGRYRIDPVEWWRWTGPLKDGAFIVDFGSHSYFLRINGYDHFAGLSQKYDNPDEEKES